MLLRTFAFHFPYKSRATQSATSVVFCLIAIIALAACESSTGSSEAVRLLITPVATPTMTQVAQPTAAPVTYTVKPGDTLSGIADLFGVTVDDIVRLNNIADPNALAEGQVLSIPGRQTSSTPVAAATGTPGTPTVVGTQSPAATPGTETPGALPVGSPTLPPPDVTPPQGPTTTEPTPGALSVPESGISPTAAP